MNGYNNNEKRKQLLLKSIGGTLVSDIHYEPYPTGLTILDIYAGGGIPQGGINLIVGDSSAGKTTLALQTAGYIQQTDSDVVVIIVDTEKSIRPDRLAQLGLNPAETIYWRRKDPSKPITIESVFQELVEDLLRLRVKEKVDTKFLIIWDSIAITPAEAELEDISKQATLQAVALTKAIKGYYQQMTDNYISMIAINHYRDRVQINPYGPKPINALPKLRGTLPGGHMQVFVAQHLLELTTAKLISDKEIDKYGFRGAVVQGTFIKNKFTASQVPFLMNFNFSKGFDNLTTNFGYLKMKGLVKQSGAYYLIDGYDKKFYFKQLADLYQNDPKFKEVFDAKVEELRQILTAELKQIEELQKKSNAEMVDPLTISDDTSQIDIHN